jgi:phage terminase large subunit GpA-like protein
MNAQPNYSHSSPAFVGFANTLISAFRPKPRYRLSDWVETSFILPDNTAVSGRWKRETAPYQADILDAVSDPAVSKVVIMSSAQIGKTFIIQAAIGYHIEHKPTPMMLLMPNVGIANRFMKSKLRPAIEKNKNLLALTGSLSGAHSENSVRYISFPGGFLTTAGTNATSDLASESVGFLPADEVDRFEQNVGDEGSPLDIARERGNSFWDFHEMLASTPVNLQTSVINREFLQGTQERWRIDCPSCAEPSVYALERFDADACTMACEHCGAIHDEYDWKQQRGQYVADNPEAFEKSIVVRSFHLNAWVSPFLSWTRIAEKYKQAMIGPRSAQKTFRNTTEGLPWDDALEKVDREGLEKRLEQYEADAPMGVRFITAGVDVQPDRLEACVIGWGVGYESWALNYHIIAGKPEHRETWEALDRALQKEYTHACGMRMGIARTFVDAGFMQATVMSYVNSRRKAYAIKGQGGENKPFVTDFSKYQRLIIPRQKPFMLGVDEGKSYVYAYLNIQEEGYGYCHFKDGLHTKEFFAQLTAESRIEVKDKKGNNVFSWIKKRDRNEALDTMVYALAAAESMEPNWQKLDRSIEEWVASRKVKTVETVTPTLPSPIGTKTAGSPAKSLRRPTRKVVIKGRKV